MTIERGMHKENLIPYDRLRKATTTQKNFLA